MQGDRWVEESPSRFPHEREGLQIVRDLLPDAPPYRAWSNFEFRDQDGRWHEVDLLVLTRGGMYLLELKHFYGTIGGDDKRWKRSHGKNVPSPLLLARRKAQYLASQLKNELHKVSKGKAPSQTVPHIQELVFLHHEHTRCELPLASRINLYGLDNHDQTSGLSGISSVLLAPPQDQPISEKQSDLLAGLIHSFGIRAQRSREVGNWLITDDTLGDGNGWQDWPATHYVDDTRKARIRFYPPVPGVPDAEIHKRKRAVTHGFRLLNRLRHDGLQVPVELCEDAELGVGWVFDDPKDYARLDLWLLDKQAGLSLDRQLELLNRIATVVQYAHRHRVVHRGLNPQAILIKERGDLLLPLVSDWDTAGVLPAGTLDTGLRGLPSSPLSGLAGDRLDIVKLYACPEGRTSSDPARMDVFGLGMLAFYLITGGAAPAAERGELMARLRRGSGLDVSAELPQAPSPLRKLILNATHPSPSERLGTVAEFLKQLDAVRAELVGVPGRTDPLEAGPGDTLDGRFVYKQRLGSGSTAVGLLVTDEDAASVPRVLKVAKDDAAAVRLQAEAQLLAKLEHGHERIVQFIQNIDVGGRSTLVLGFAGATTLAEELSAKGRLSINLLERWGTDLLSAVRGLEQAGLVHRDIKPANLGVSSHKSESHLTLFDFSMAAVDARNVEAGTPPYLDPFLGTSDRRQYDSAAERYGAAVVLYEMATGSLPQYGADPDANPAAVQHDVTIDPERFEPAVAPSLAEFFATALSRETSRRPGTAEEMLRAWRQVFSELGTAPKIVDADQHVGETTSLADSGLSVRAASALATLQVATIGELLALDSTKLNRLLSKESAATRKEIAARYKQWKQQLGTRKPPARTELPGLSEAVDLLLAAVGTGKRTRRKAQSAESDAEQKSTRQQAAELILGRSGRLDAFASAGELGKTLGMKESSPRGHQLLKELQVDWGAVPETAALLDDVATVVTRVINDFGGVAAVDMLSAEVRALAPEPTDTHEYVARRAAEGLVRVAFDRLSEHEQLDGARKLLRRRHGGRLTLVAGDEKLLAAAERAGRRADDLVRDVPEGVVAPTVGAREVREAYLQGYRSAAPGVLVSPPPDERLIRLAAAASRQAVVSGRGELHCRHIAPAAMIRIALAGLSQSESLSTTELRQRVAARFPVPDKLPMRPALDVIVTNAELGLGYDESAKVYRFLDVEPPGGTGLPTRKSTTGASVPASDIERVWTGYANSTRATVLRRSIDGYGFLAIGVPIGRADDHTRAAEQLADHYCGDILDVAGAMVAEIRGFTDGRVPWPDVLTADAANAVPRDARGLRTVVDRVTPVILDRIDAKVFTEPASARPLILTELGPLARYGFLQRVGRWSDLTAPRRRPIWVILPELHQIRGAQVDGLPIQLGSPTGQFVEYRPGADAPDPERVMR
ncbi:BREX system serine/threonine kinase PglW [Nocardia iowensis]|uniref:non-specific serine/threonine protein kinase n=2 Tax=Nocardia iowensis TaxID=204891 RepID=A0ABX8S2W7_NOCIO|nr:BREX system serine/threonine kinase PglW [Nocardia iowensis]QXN95404.1 BREX system serine/threonine kinase PglW [Nocardia iowensis]